MPRRTFGSRLAQLRKAAGWTQEELAQRINDAGGRERGSGKCTQERVARWETGGVKPRDASLKAIRAVFPEAAEELLALVASGWRQEAEESTRRYQYLLRAMEAFVAQYEDFHGEYRRIAQEVVEHSQILARIEATLMERQGPGGPQPLAPATPGQPATGEPRRSIDAGPRGALPPGQGAMPPPRPEGPSPDR